MILYALRHKPTGLFRHKKSFTYKRPKPDNIGGVPDLYQVRPPLSWGIDAMHGKGTTSDWEVVAFECNMVATLKEEPERW